MGSAGKVITILHFNDVYNIEPRDQEPVGGAARFTTALREFTHLNPLVLFSGDAFNPSLMSTITKGKQMIPTLNAMNIQCAVFGNHDFDYGVDTLVKLAQQCNFPWMMSNVTDNITDKPLADGITTHMIEWQGVKFGLIGLVEEEWIATLATIDPDEITFLDYVEEGRTLARQLRQQGAEYIIALTHMRWPNDERLAEEVDEIDLILGGHDHDYNKKLVNNKWVLKSGTDFRNFSQVTLTFQGSGVKVDIEEVLVTSKYEADEEVKKVVDEFMRNFVCDIMLKATEADFAMINSGTLRSDCIHPKGPFKMKDLFSILPMMDPLVVLKIKGSQVIQALENSVSQYPKLEGRFAQVAGISFAFDPNAPPGQRVDPNLVKIQDHYLNPHAYYRLVTKQYLSEGKDGYDVFKDCEILVNDDDGPRLSTIVQNHFRSINSLRSDKPTPYSHHRQSIVSLCRRRSIVRQMSLQIDDYEPDPDQELVSPAGSSAATSGVSSPLSGIIHPALTTPNAFVPYITPPTSNFSVSSSRSGSSSGQTSPGSVRRAPRLRSKSMMVRRLSVQSMEEDVMSIALAPRVDGRIICLTPELKRQMEEEKMSANVLYSTIQE